MFGLASLLSDKACSEGLSLVGSKVRQWYKLREINRLVAGYRKRAAMISTSVDLASRFDEVKLVEELIAHESKMDVDRSEMIGFFLGSSSDDNAVALVSEFLDELDEILSPEIGTLADRRNRTKLESIQRDTNTIRKSVTNYEASKEAQLSLLKELLEPLGRNAGDIEDISALLDSVEGSVSSAYLRAYCDLCAGSRVDFSFEKDIKGRDDLVLILAGVAVSAGRLAEVRRILRLCSFETGALDNAIEMLLNDVPRTSNPIEIEVPDATLTRELVGLLNFECMYRRHAYKPAVDMSDGAAILWNPIASERLRLSNLAAEAMLDDSQLLTLASEVIGSFRSWFPDFLVGELRYVLSMAFSWMTEECVRGCVDQFPEGLACFGQDVLKGIELQNCQDAETAKSIFVWAEARANPDLLLDAAHKLVNLNEAERPRVVVAFEGNYEWAFPNVRLLSLYATHINPGMSYETYCKLGHAFACEPVFHLTAYQLLESSNPEESERHIERAIELMRAPDKGVEMLFSHAWVPYLVQKNRVEELIQLVEGPLPHAPYALAMSFFRSVANCDKDGDLLDRVINSMDVEAIEDPRTAEAVACHLRAVGSSHLAGRIALKALKARPTDALAGMVAQWEVESSLAPDPELLAYIKQSDTSEMNIVAANLEREDSNESQQNDNLIRAAFGGGEVSKRALVLFAVWNAGIGEELVNPVEVRPDTYVKVRSGEGREKTLVFPVSRRAVKSDGLEGPAGFVFGTSSKIYLQLVGQHVGDVVAMDDGPWSVVEIGNMSSLLKRVGFSEMSAMPETMTFSGSPEETLDELVEMMREQQPSVDPYVNGVESNGTIIYFGIETGARIAPRDRRLEFVLNAIENQNMPFRRSVVCRNCALSTSTKFLLSYNSIAVLALLDLPDELKAHLITACVMTESTIRHVKKDAERLVGEQFGGSVGRLGYAEGGLVMLEYDENTRGQAKDMCSSLIDFVDSIGSVRPSLGLGDRRAAEVLSDNEAIDIRTASEKGLVYVTEDVLEAQIVDMLALCDRCSTSGLFVALGHIGYVLSEFSVTLRRWGAQPVLENDLQQVLGAAINAALRTA